MTTLTFSERTKFKAVCNMLEQVKNSSKRDQKVDIMKQFIAAYHEQSKNRRDDSFYPILRLLLPELERERGPYGIKEHRLANLYIKILCIAPGSKDGQKLTNYRSSSTNGSDFADVVSFILKSRCTGEKELTVHEVNSHLDNIATKHAENQPAKVEEELKNMIMNMSPTEQKWLIRVLLKDMHLGGLSTRKILYLFHPDANDLFDVTANDLQKVCITLKDPSIRLNEIAVVMFQPFKPMLSQRCDVQAVNKDIREAESYYVETKFDGERFQLHFQEGEFRYFSRMGFEYTNTYGCNSSMGVLTPHLAALLNPGVKSCILDGEMMCWNQKRKCFTTKGSDIDVKSLKIGHIHQPCFCVFDVLLHNGTVMTNKPLSERFKVLEEIIQPKEGVLVISDKDIVKSGTQILNLLNQAIENNEEGIVVKDPSSVYKPNARNAGWYKIKPEYTEGVMVELDMLIIGGYYGKGRRHGLISQFLLGIADSKKGEDNKPCSFLSVARVGSGYSDDELSKLNSQLEKCWKKVRPNQMPPEIVWTKEKPDLWIKPSESAILQVKATEVTPSDGFKVGYTLRFPRVEKIRSDKPWYDCLTADEFSNIRQAHYGKLTANYATKLNESQPSTSKRTVKRTKQLLTLSEDFQCKKVKNLERQSTIFDAKEMCVLTGLMAGPSKSELEEKILQNGGTVVQNPGTETFCVIAGVSNIRVTNMMKLTRHDIIKPCWILDCVDSRSLKKLQPDHYLAMTPKTVEKLRQEYDEYGDSYTEPITEDRLKELMNSITVEETDTLNHKDMIALDREVFGKKRNPIAIFRGCYACFHGSYEDNELKYVAPVVKLMFKYHGGVEVPLTDKEITHVISFERNKLPEDVERVVASRKLTSVHHTWITESWTAHDLLNASSFNL